MTAAGVGRYYDPQTGQFLSVDPEVRRTLESFLYSGDDPVSYNDPTGRSCSSWQWWLFGVALCLANEILHPPNPSFNTWCMPSNPPHGETFYGPDGCITYQTGPGGYTAIGVVMAPWTPSDGVFNYIAAVNGGSHIHAKWDQAKWPTLHDAYPPSEAPRGSHIAVITDYVAPGVIYHNVPNEYTVPHMQRDSRPLNNDKDQSGSMSKPSPAYPLLQQVCRLTNAATPLPFVCLTNADGTVEFIYNDVPMGRVEPDMTDVAAGVRFLLSEVQDCISRESREPWPEASLEENVERSFFSPVVVCDDDEMELVFEDSMGNRVTLGSVSLAVPYPGSESIES